MLPHSLYDYTALGATPVTQALTAIVLLFSVYWVASAVYLAKLHPLSKFPEPLSASFSFVPFWISCITGRQVQWMQELHNKYGPVVRYGPNQLSYMDRDSTAWREIHGHEKGGREFPKAREWFVAPYNGKFQMDQRHHIVSRVDISALGVYGINSAPSHEDHRRFRQIFGPAFSDRAMKQLEPTFQRNVDLLLSTLNEPASLGQSVNMVEKYQFTAFDIMGELIFGESLGLLQSNQYTKTVEPQSVKEMKYNHFKHSADRLDKRLQRGSDETDVWSMVLDGQQEKRLSVDEIHCHGDVFMLAGTETIGTALSGVTYYLVKNEEKLALLLREIRTKFRNQEEITFQTASELVYLNACIREALRLYPPVPVGVPRVVPNELSGVKMPGGPVPTGTRVSVHHYATYRSAENFRDPDSFVPERWLNDPAYSTDNRECCRPFALGPRNCLGQTMAYREMQLLLARHLFSYNLEMEEGVAGWDDQYAFILWEKKPLMCRLTLASPEIGLE